MKRRLAPQTIIDQIEEMKREVDPDLCAIDNGDYVEVGYQKLTWLPMPQLGLAIMVELEEPISTIDESSPMTVVMANKRRYWDKNPYADVIKARAARKRAKKDKFEPVLHELRRDFRDKYAGKIQVGG
jgi:hypothetical protein